MKDNGLYQYYITTTTTTVRYYGNDDDRNDHIELDDTAPLPLFIGIGLALFIGFVLLVLICCLCRRRRVPPTTVPDRPVNTTHYQRAPMNDAVGMGTAYPLASVPPMPYPNQTIVYQPPHLGPTIQHNYGVIGSGIPYSNANHIHYSQQQQQHVPTYAPSHYVPTIPLAPHSTPLQSHSPSHSSQASSSVSGATADPLMPSASPFIQQQQQQQQQYHHPQSHKFHQFAHQQQMPPVSALQHHQHLQQQQFITGRQSPAVLYSQMTYSAMLANDHSVTPRPDPTTPNIPPPQLNSPVPNHLFPQPPQQPPQQLAQSPSYTDDENE